MTYIPNSIEARDIASLVHMQTNLRRHQTEGPLVITRGEGCRVFDNTGRDYIEAVAGLWCASLGFGSERLAKVAYEQMRELGYYHLYRHRSNEPAIAAGREAARDRAGADGARALPVLGLGGQRHGHQARLVLLERHGPAAAHQDHRPPVRLPRQHLRGGEPVRQAGHARGLRPAVRAASSTPSSRTTTAATSRARARSSSPPAWPSALEELIEARGARHHRRLLRRAGDGRGRRDHAARGLFRRRSRRCCRKHDILFVADEVICGFARTGEMWGSRDLRHRARHAHLGQGALGRHAADLGGAAQRARARGDAGAVGHLRQLRARLHLRRPSGGGGGRAGGAEDLRRDGYRGRAPSGWSRCCSRRWALPRASAGRRRARRRPDPRHGADARRREAHAVRPCARGRRAGRQPPPSATA